MSNSPNEIALALLATLEAHARKKGKKSLVRQVAKRLRKAGVDAGLVSQVEAVSTSRKSAAAPRPAAKPRGKSKAPAEGAAQPAA